ncbi:MAG: Wzz/FepE/Etk N-terminal domain-containing protein [Bacteroidales bacterium]
MDNKTQKSYNFNSVDLLIYIWKKRWILGGVGFIAAVASIIISLMITPMFEASVIMFPANNVMVSKELLVQNFSGKNVHGFGEEEQAEQLLQVLNSEPVRTRVIQKYDLMEHYEIDPDSKYPMTELFEQYRSNINFRLTEYMSVEISVRDKDPEYAASIANDISDLVDTVYNSMIKDRAWEALRLVEREYRESEVTLAHLRDSLDLVSHQLSSEMETGDEPTDMVIRALSENGAFYFSMINLVRNQSSIVAGLSLRYKEARLEAEQDLSYKFVVERAIPPEKKAYPNKSLIVIVSTFASLLFALIVLIVIDNIKARVAIQEEK